MDYRRFGDDIVLKIERGEEVMEKLKEVSLKENIKLASVEGLGATNDFQVGLFDVSAKQYYSQNYTGDYEIVSLTGSINTMNDEYYSHIHLSAAGSDHVTVGGHLNKAVISGVGELFIHVINGRVDRVHDDELGLNVYKF